MSFMHFAAFIAYKCLCEVIVLFLLCLSNHKIVSVLALITVNISLVTWSEGENDFNLNMLDINVVKYSWDQWVSFSEFFPSR